MAVEPAKVPIIFKSDRRLTALSVSLMVSPWRYVFVGNFIAGYAIPEQRVCRGTGWEIVNPP
jgi:hypothetical protein